MLELRHLILGDASGPESELPTDAEMYPSKEAYLRRADRPSHRLVGKQPCPKKEGGDKDDLASTYERITGQAHNDTMYGPEQHGGPGPESQVEAPAASPPLNSQAKNSTKLAATVVKMTPAAKAGGTPKKGAKKRS